MSYSKSEFKKNIELVFALFFRLAYGISSAIRFESINTIVRMAKWRAKLGSIGGNVNIYPDVIIHNTNKVHIGNSVSIAEFVHMWGGGGIKIGDNTLIASHTVITTQTHSTDCELYRDSLECKPVAIGENVWIGAGAIILPGVTIGKNSIIGSGSLVNKDVPENVIAVGIPAKVLRKLG
jgi:maltose O-acetyltransferase